MRLPPRPRAATTKPHCKACTGRTCRARSSKHQCSVPEARTPTLTSRGAARRVGCARLLGESELVCPRARGAVATSSRWICFIGWWERAANPHWSTHVQRILPRLQMGSRTFRGFYSTAVATSSRRAWWARACDPRVQRTRPRPRPRARGHRRGRAALAPHTGFRRAATISCGMETKY